MSRVKYVTLEDATGLRFPIVFPELVGHDCVVKAFPHCKPVGAGFVSIGVDADGNQTVSAYGKSVALNNLGTDAEDEFYLKKMFDVD